MTAGAKEMVIINDYRLEEQGGLLFRSTKDTK
jgi:hypothetical protein